jgi:RHS repeat-associated protein
VKVESGHGTQTVSVSETVYEACGCSPIGKTKKVSMPAAGAAVNWTVYNYDALGRTTSVVAPDGSTKSYLYVANTVQVTDEAGKWKKYWMDGFGNLTQVQEPDPANPTMASYYTTYSYDVLGHLTLVSMPRPTGTQTRTFNYGTPVGPYVLSATNPENGTVSYTYTWYGSVATKTDAKGVQTRYSYDDLRRLTQISYFTQFPPSWVEDVAARVTMSYDTNPVDGSYSQSALGRMTTRQYTVNGTAFTDMYSYTGPGQVAGKRLRVTRYGVSADLNAAWSYDNEGKLSSVSYPLGGSYNYGYNEMGQLKTMKDPNDPNQGWLVSDAQYGPAGELLTMAGAVNETRSYNSRLQVTEIQQMIGCCVPTADTQYRYTAGSNSGKIASQYDVRSGEEIVYQYDALNRLASAVTTDNASVPQWGQGFSYDGFGNLTGKTVLKGSAPVLSVGVDAATNRLMGYSYDANGNQLSSGTQTLAYDYENRITSTASGNAGAMYGYDPDNRRVYTVDWTYNGGTEVTSYLNETVYFFGVDGRRMGSYLVQASPGNPPYSGPSMSFVVASARAYFGGKLITGDSGTVAEDRLGSVGKYYPYGEVRGSVAASFATYTRDAGGLDYAGARYYHSGLGRFMSADPYTASGGPGDPGSWNRYAYVQQDPINLIDPTGLYAEYPSGGDDQPRVFFSTTVVATVDWSWANLVAAGWAMDARSARARIENFDWDTYGGGGSSSVRVLPKVPAGNSYTRTQMNSLTNGLNAALAHTDNVDCAMFFAAGDDDPSLASANVLENTTYRLLPLPSGTGASTNGLTDVMISTTGAFFNTTPNSNGTVTVLMPNSAGVTTSFTFAGTSTLQAFMMLHELGHQMGVYGTDINAATNGGNSQGVLDHCFSRDAQGVYH